ncbi:hypothetical protein ACO0LM_05090 [Undibacterium sp. Di26W]|uniref:hypothetical protein n=1 Tax=Undibacterium sp. Di26W TaxID=3413035 RepID=UPI003BF17F0C
MQALYYRKEIGSADWLKILQSRWQMLAVVTLAHLLLFVLWPTTRLHKSDSFLSRALWVRMLEIPAPPKPGQAVPLVKQSLPVRPPTVVKTPATTATTTTNAAVAGSTEVSPTTSQTTEPVSQTTAPDMAIENPVTLQRDIRSIIKGVEREMPNRILTAIRPEKSSMVAFAINVEAAARPRGTSYKNIVMSDGTAMTKVTTSAGSYCVIGAKPGADITRAPGIRTVSCGSY